MAKQNHETDTVHLLMMMSGIDGFRGVFSTPLLHDMKPLKQGESLIFNVSVKDKGKYANTHWVAAWCGKSYVLYFDSMGVPPSNQAVDFLLRSHRNVYFNPYQIQMVESSACGQFCVAFLREAHTLRSGDKALRLFRSNRGEFDTPANEHRALDKSDDGLMGNFKGYGSGYGFDRHPIRAHGIADLLGSGYTPEEIAQQAANEAASRQQLAAYEAAHDRAIRRLNIVAEHPEATADELRAMLAQAN